MTPLTDMIVQASLAEPVPLIPGGTPTPIPGLDGDAAQLINYGLWLVLLSGVAGAGIGVVKLAISDKGRGGGGAEPAKWMIGGVAAALLSGSLVAILNGIAGT
ncbi:hypothetical protein [Streptomyces sp. NPDC058486]|uniref:hypothetical protein n=1 Tax=unclassified Streptomyces TaxID=2593676 RepID=UPI00364AA255